MIKNEQEYRVTLERIERFQRQVAQLRKAERNPENYRLSASGFLAELDRMNLELREYLWSHPSELAEARTA
jgi:lipase chaperone LimK